MIQLRTNTAYSGKAVKPIEKIDQIEQIRNLLSDKPRHLLLFEIAIRTGLTMKQILGLKVKDIIGGKPGDKLYGGQAVETKSYSLVITKTIYNAWQKYRKDIEPKKGDYLFSSRKGGGPLSLSSVSHLVNSWFRILGLEDLSGAISLRKTWQVYYKGNMLTPFDKRTDPLHTLEPVKSQNTLQELVYKSMFEKIISGQIPPGERLVIEKVARHLNVSTIPVREAFQRLHTAGLITMGEKQSTIVNELSIQDFKEITRIRLLIEIEAVEEAATRCEDNTAERLKALHEEWKEVIKKLKHRKNAENVNLFLKLNREFHHTIYREANMPILQKIIEGLWNRISPYQHILIESIDDYIPGETIHIHRGMLMGMMEKKPREVSKWLRRDINKASKISIQFLNRF